MRLRTWTPLLFLVVVACSKDKSAEQARPAPAKPALAPKEQFSDAYEEVFQRGPMLPIDQRIQAFLPKVPAPAKVDGGTRTWFLRDADKGCYEVTLSASGTMESSKIMDAARADASCGAAK